MAAVMMCFARERQGTRILTLIRRAGLEAADAGLVFGLQRVVLFYWDTAG